jgi:hypothetical protein
VAAVVVADRHAAIQHLLGRNSQRRMHNLSAARGCSSLAGLGWAWLGGTWWIRSLSRHEILVILLSLSLGCAISRSIRPIRLETSPYVENCRKLPILGRSGELTETKICSSFSARERALARWWRPALEPTFSVRCRWR